MKTFAVIDDNTVVNLIVAESREIGEEVTGLTCIEYIVPEIGWVVEDGTLVPNL